MFEFYLFHISLKCIFHQDKKKSRDEQLTNWLGTNLNSINEYINRIFTAHCLASYNLDAERLHQRSERGKTLGCVLVPTVWHGAGVDLVVDWKWNGTRISYLVTIFSLAYTQSVITNMNYIQHELNTISTPSYHQHELHTISTPSYHQHKLHTAWTKYNQYT
jgi:hypothetical protein